MPATHLNRSRKLRRLFMSAAFVVLSAVASHAQTPLNGYTPEGMAPGSPAEAYTLSGFDNVSLYSGSLNVALPLLKVGGRGEAQYTMMLRPVRTKWVVQHQALGFGSSFNYASNEWWTSVTPGYSVGVLEGRRGGAEPCQSNTLVNTLTRLTFTAADGTEYELRDNASGGVTQLVPCRDDGAPSFNRGKVFSTADGASATFISDVDIFDYTNGGVQFQPSGHLMLGDGTRFRISQGEVMWMRDRNGNRLTFTRTLSSLKINDSLGREVDIAYDVDDGPPYGHCDRITYKGFGGQARVIRVSEGAMSTSMRSSETTKQYFELFGETWGGMTFGTYDDVRVTAVWLPDGRSYKFRYNSYGEVARVELPTGGAVEYDYGPGVATSYPNGLVDLDWRGEIAGGAPYQAQTIIRRVWERREYPDGGAGTSFARRTVYSAGQDHCNSELGSVEVYHFKPDGTEQGVALGGQRHWFYGSPCGSMLSSSKNPGQSPSWKEGREYKTESLAPDGQTVLRRLEHTWQQPVAGTNWPLMQAETNDSARTNYPHVTQTLTTLTDTGQVSKQTFSYDQYGNKTDVYEYDFGATAGSAGALMRRTHTDFVTAPAYVNAHVDTNQGAHLRSLPLQTWVSADGGNVNKVSLTAYAYDQSPLTDRPNITGLCNSFANGQCAAGDPMSLAARGNVTGVTRFANPSGATGPATQTTTYDVAGNIVSATDANGNTTQLSYADSFCNGAGCDGTFTANTYTFPTLMTSPVPDVSAAHNRAPGTFGSTSALTSSLRYDFYTGHVYSMTDANNETTTLEYNDPLDRLTAVIRPAGGGRTDFDYSEPAEAGTYVRTIADLDSARRTEKKQYFDGMGRAFRSLTFENHDPAKQWLATDTEYDAFGRVRYASKPYRSVGGATPLTQGQWGSTPRSETEYDALGRAKTVTTWPDGAAVKIDYSGDRVLVTDPANRQRISRTDAAERLTEVWEVRGHDAASGTEAVTFPSRPGVPAVAAGYRTGYVYDALGNLRTATQGAQTRTFVYDPLGHLTSATNPESGTVGYTYDANGNLNTRTDARGVTVTLEYDRLNRNIITTYAGGGTSTPTVNRHYDAATKGRGRLHRTHTVGVSETVFDAYDTVGRPTQYRQAFWVNNAWGKPFKVSRTYDRAGHALTQTYPSGHVVTYNYEAAGRPGDNGGQAALAGNLGDGVQRTYSSGISYSELGGMREERFGTQTPLYHKLHYNSRAQLFDVRLSTHSLQANEWDWNRGAIVNYYGSNYVWEGNPSTPAGPDNNGNVLRQEHWVPADDQISSHTFTRQTYEYDQLNRLSSVVEAAGANYALAPDSFKQAYVYDRWGNRTIDAGPTWGAPEPQFELSPQANQEVPEPSNRLYAPGDSARPPAAKLMRYDAAGNLTHDAYTGNGPRAYDAENRMTAAYDNTGNWASYAYDADGHRVKRNVRGQETWLVYGMDGELLAEYSAGAAPFVSTKEYAYRGGRLLFTATSGDAGRMTRFVKNLHYNALARDPTAGEMQQQTETLTNAGVQGQPQLLTAARGSARAIFESAEYAARGRTDAQYVTDLYNSYLQRGPDDGGLAHWLGGVQANGRPAVLQAFEECAEFERLVQTLYGTHAGGDNQRVEHFVRTFYQGARRTDPTSAEMQQQTQRLNAAAAVGESQVVAEARAMGLEVFQATNFNGTRTDEQYVTDLYQAFLQRGPDGGGLAHWLGGVQANGRPAVLQAFQQSAEFTNLARTLYRETFWLVADHLGTPRMVVSKTGSLAGIKRHDYLPFGEELSSGTGGRAPVNGYGPADNVGQKFTAQERDDETGLDYFLARFYSAAAGRFTGADPGRFTPADPQNWNRFAYVQNNPLKFVDPDGRDLFLTGPDADYIMAELEHYTGLKLNRDPKTGQVTVDPSVERKEKGTSFWLALKVLQIIRDQKRWVTINTGRNQPGVMGDSFELRALDVADYDAYKSADKKLAAKFLGHVLDEYYHAETMPSPYSNRARYEESHPHAQVFESLVLGEFTGEWEQPRKDTLLRQSRTELLVRLEYTTVFYDILFKTGPGNNISVANVTVTQKKR